MVVFQHQFYSQNSHLGVQLLCHPKVLNFLDLLQPHHQLEVDLNFRHLQDLQARTLAMQDQGGQLSHPKLIQNQ